MSKNSIIKLTSSALVQLGRIAKEHSSSSILFSIKGGGCNGYTYKLKPTNEIPDKLDEIVCLKDQISSLPDTIDTPLENIQVCGHSLMHLLGTEIDWKKDIMGEAFHFTNPMAASSCGCGTSFNSKKN